MRPRTITIEANDISSGSDLVTKIANDLFWKKIDFDDFDALFDRIFDCSGGFCIVVKHAEKLSKNARDVLDNALAHSTELEVVLEYSHGRTKRFASPPASKVNISITENDAGGSRGKGWWHVFFSRLVRFFLWMMALGLISMILIVLFQQTIK